MSATGRSIRRGSVEANGIEFAFITAGEGPLALCLHGFPDSAHTWRHLLPALADAGFRAVAPFARGYAPTSLAADHDYQLGALVADAVALHTALDGDERAVIIGHDWVPSSIWHPGPGWTSSRAPVTSSTWSTRPRSTSGSFAGSAPRRPASALDPVGSTPVRSAELRGEETVRCTYALSASPT